MLDPTKVKSGSFGKLFDSNGDWLTNVTKVEATVEFDKEDVLVAGTRWKGKKVIGVNGVGSITEYFVTTALLERIAQGADDNKSAFVTELIYSVNDPDSAGTYRVRLKGVTFDSIPLITSEVGSLITSEYPFTFTGFQIMNGVA